MADLTEVKKILQKITMRIEALEENVANDCSKSARVSEPIITCVQCQEEYTESQNGEGYCRYHLCYPERDPASLKYIFKCCNQNAENPHGCRNAKHCSKHHDNYPYAAYSTFIMDTVQKARQVWLEIDVDDFTAVGCKWAEVGLSEDCKVYIVCGENSLKYNGFKLLDIEKLKEYTNEGVSVLLNKTSDVGWSIKASMIISKGPVRAIEVSVKPASSLQVTTKRVTLNLTGTIPAIESMEDISVAVQKPINLDDYVLPKDVTQGPVIDISKDYSKDRKNDYTTETDDGFRIKIKQIGDTKADLSFTEQDGKWTNLFTAIMVFMNTGDSDLAIANMEGYYFTAGDGLSEWVKCDNGLIGVQSFDNNGISYQFHHTPTFNVKLGEVAIQVIRLCIKKPGKTPSHNVSAKRAHHSLPQPLHLKAVFTDCNERKSSIRFEFGNPLPTIGANKSSYYSYCFADDLHSFTRSYAAICFNDGILNYETCFEERYYHQAESCSVPQIKKIAFNAKQAEKPEIELHDVIQKVKETEIKVYALIDLDNEIAYGLKMMVKTPTSLAITYCKLPQLPDPSTVSLCVTQKSVKVGHEITIKWQVTNAFKGDHIFVFAEYGKKDIEEMRYFNEEAKLIGEVTRKAPTTAGVYEARYYYYAWRSQCTDWYHDIYIKKAKFTVVSL